MRQGIPQQQEKAARVLQITLRASKSQQGPGHEKRWLWVGKGGGQRGSEELPPFQVPALCRQSVETEDRTLVKVSSFMTSDKRIINCKIINLYGLGGHQSQAFRFVGNTEKFQVKKTQTCFKNITAGDKWKKSELCPSADERLGPLPTPWTEAITLLIINNYSLVTND